MTPPRAIDRRRFLQQTALAGLAPLALRLQRVAADQEVWILRPPSSDFTLRWASAELSRGLRTLGLAREPAQAVRGEAEPPSGAVIFTLAVQREAFRHPEAFEIARDAGGARIGGATPRAVLYGVFGFLERQGAFFGLDGEVFPLDPSSALALPPPGRPWLEQPRFDVRGLVPWPDFLNGIETFDCEDLRAYLEAMVRMRFNTIGLHVYSGVNQWAESFLSFEYGGVGHLAFTDTTATHRWGYLPERTSRFGMGSPDYFADEVFGSEATTGARSVWEAQERAQALWRDALRYASALGVRTGVGFEPSMIPDEIFRATPPEARAEPKDPRLPGSRVDPESAAARDILEARLGALLDAYPDVDDLWLWEDEAMNWVSHETKVPLSVTPFLQAHRFLQRHAPTKRLVVSGWGGVTRHFADFHKRLPADVIFSSLSDTFGWEPVSEEFGRLGTRERWPVLWIEDDPAMWLPQFHVHRVARDIDRAAGFGCQGLLGIHWRHRIVDATAGFQARHSWHGDLRPEQFYGEMARAYARAPRAGRLAVILNDADRDRRLLGTFTGEIKDGRRQTREYAGDYGEAFAFWNGYEPDDAIRRSEAEVARALDGLMSTATSAAERERIAYIARHVAFLVPYAESWSIARRLQQVLQKAQDLKQSGGADQARALVAAEGVPLWLSLAPLVREAILTFQSIVSTRNDLGTLASMHNKYERLALVRLRLSMKEFLGELPAAVEAALEDARRPDAGARPRVLVPARPTLLRPGERVRITAVVPGGARAVSASLRSRGGSGVWSSVPMRLRGRRTYEADLGWVESPGTVLEYYVEAEVEMPAGIEVRLCRAPLEAPELLYAVSLVAQP